MRISLAVVLAAVCGPAMAAAQVFSSENLACTVVAAGGMACNGIGASGIKGVDKKVPKLFVTHFTLEPGAALDEPSSPSDCLIIGIQGGDLVNEKLPSLHVSLERRL
jgi:hypothetical protein